MDRATRKLNGISPSKPKETGASHTGEEEEAHHEVGVHIGEHGGRHGQQRRPFGARQDDVPQFNEPQWRPRPSGPGQKYPILRQPPQAFIDKSGAMRQYPPSIGGNEANQSEGQLCNICYKRKPLEDFRKSLPHPNCVFNHVPMCETCIGKSINTQLSSVHWDKICCPLDRLRFPADLVRQYLQPAALPKYNRFWEMHPIRNEPNFLWCASPSCEWGQLHEGGNQQPKMTCKKCFFATCFTHGRPWHEGQTCKEFDDQLDPGQKQQIVASDQHMKQISVPCPKCSTPVTKAGGCSSVLCLCGKVFNWNAAMALDSGSEDSGSEDSDEMPS